MRVRYLFGGFVFVLSLTGFKSYGQVPSISGFSPTSGPIGTIVTITGSNFSATPANNIVFFGATNANVTAASTTSLTVTVPIGATYQPITVLTNGLLAYSSKPFLVTFNGVSGIDATSFAAKSDFATGTSPPSVSIGDLDGDGKADLAVANYTSNTVSVFRNTILSIPTITGFTPTSGAVGTSVTITGTNFDVIATNNIVKFNGIIAAITGTPTATSITTSIPTVATTGAITITVNGQTGTSSSNFLVVPAAAQNVTSSSIGATSFKINWSASPGATDYYLNVSTISDFTSKDILNNFFVGNVTSYVVTGLNPSTTYYYFVTATNASGSSDFIILSATTLPTEPSAQPTDITFTNIGDVGFNYTVTPPTSVPLGYLLIRKAGSSPTGVPVDGMVYSVGDVIGDGIVEFAGVSGKGFVQGLTASSSYFYDVYAYNYSSGKIRAQYFNNKDLTGAPVLERDEIEINGNYGMGSPDPVVNVDNFSARWSFTFKATATGGYTFYGNADDGGRLWINNNLVVDRWAGQCCNWPATTVSLIAGVIYPIVMEYNEVSGFASVKLEFSLPSSSIKQLVDAAPATSINYFTTLPLEKSVTTSGPPSISSFTPTSGPVGTSVTITGTNFSTTAGNNTVLFGSISASITGTPTATSLTATVPASATTGKIIVTVGGRTSQSSTDFIVNTPSSPTIASFNPTSGIAGATVTITGTNFSITPASNSVKFNGTTAVVTASTTLSITTSVPAGATTGKITVTVGGQTATSASDFTVSAVSTTVIITDKSFPATFDKGSTLTVSITVNDATKVKKVNFKSRGISEAVTALKSAAVTASGNKFEVIVPSTPPTALTDPIGSTYFFEVTDLTDAVVNSTTGSSFVKYLSTLSEQVLPALSFGSTADKYQIVAVPLALTSNNVTAVFSSLMPAWS